MTFRQALTMNIDRHETKNDWGPVHALALVGMMIVSDTVPVFRIWPLLWIVPLVGYAVLVAVIPPLRRSFKRWRFGRISKGTIAATTIFGLGAGAVLLVCLPRERSHQALGLGSAEADVAAEAGQR